MSFNIALSGINSASTDLDVISNNIANANTVGFKDSRAEFADLILGTAFSASNVAPGGGVTTQETAQQFIQGTITATNNPLDIAISGSGFFTMNNAGTPTYSRNGAFGTDNNGYVVNDQGFRLEVYPPVPNTNTFSTGSFQDLQIPTAPSPPSATTTAALDVTLPANAPQPANAPFNATDPTTYNSTTATTVYDSLGAPHSLNVYYAQTAVPGAWQVHYVVDGTDLAPPTAGPPATPGGATITFDSSGNLASVAGHAGQTTLALPAVPLAAVDGAAPLSVTLNLDSSVQYGDQFSVTSLTQDGYTTGQLSGVQIGQSGIVSATYSNGQNVTLGQIAMANFADPQGLQQVGNSSWVPTATSGDAIPGQAGASNFGLLQSGSVESSNTDLTTQLVDMMTAQRNYQANSQVISTEDQLLQTILHLQ